MKHNFTSYIKSFAFIFFAMSTGFTKSPIDTIVAHHMQRRILVNTDIIGNKDSIRQESEAITGILTTTTVDIKRQASTQEKFDVLRAVMGERFVARLTEVKNTGSFSVKTDSNPYTDVFKKLTPDNTTLRNHYRVLELTYNLGDLLATCTPHNTTIETMSRELLSLTGMNYCFLVDLIDSVKWEHHLATCNQVDKNIFELISQFEQQNKPWLAKTTLNAVVEIKSHPLSKFAQIYMNLMLRDIESEDTLYSQAEQESILESLNSIWGEDYSPYQFSAVKFLVLSPYKAFWDIGTLALNSIVLYEIASPTIANLGRESQIIVRRRDEEAKKLRNEIKANDDTLSKIPKEIMDYEKLHNGINIDSLILDNCILRARLIELYHPEQQAAHNFLYIEQWDTMESNDINQKLLKDEILMAKNLMARNDLDRLTEVISKFLLSARMSLSLTKKDADYEKLKSELSQYDYLFASSDDTSLDDTLLTEYRIKTAEEIKKHVKEEIAERARLNTGAGGIKTETKLDIATKSLLNKFLNLKERSLKHTEIKFKLFKNLLCNTPADNQSYLTALIFDSVTNTDEFVRTRKETVAA